MDEASPFILLCLPCLLRQGRIKDRVRRILHIPSWEGHCADPVEKQGPCVRHQSQIDGKVCKRLT